MSDDTNMLLLKNKIQDRINYLNGYIDGQKESYAPCDEKINEYELEILTLSKVLEGNI